MSKSLLSSSRTWHRRIASLLFIFFFIVALTGLMLGWKSLFTKTIFDNKEIKAEKKLNKWLSLDTLEVLAAVALNEKTNNHFTHAESIQLRLASGLINFLFKKKYYVQVDGGTGALIHIEQKNGGIIQDIHDGAIVDGWLHLNSEVAKTIYSTIMGLSLLFLVVSGFYLWFKPKQIKTQRKSARVEKFSNIEITTSQL
jgi:uncharacterized iron-regulated membrane protein